MTRIPQGPAALFLSVALLAASLAPARADEPGAGKPGAEAGHLVEEVLRKAGRDGPGTLGDWSRSIIDRALDRAGETARQTIPGSESPGSESGAGGADSGASGRSAPPLQAERHAGTLGGSRSPASEILIFTSLSVPAQSWRQWARDAARSGVPLLLRGVGAGGLRETAKRIGDRLGGAEAGVAIDPRLFRLFGVTRVPAVVVVPGGAPPCESRGCAGDTAPPHDLVTGNIGLVAALEAVAAEGDAGHAVADARLERLAGDRR